MKLKEVIIIISKVHMHTGVDPGGHGDQKTPLPESYRESLKSGVVA